MPWIQARSAVAIVSNMRILMSATILVPSEPSATVDTQSENARTATATTIRAGNTKTSVSFLAMNTSSPTRFRRNGSAPAVAEFMVVAATTMASIGQCG